MCRKKQIKVFLERIYWEWFLLRRRINRIWWNIKIWMRENWVDALIDSGLVLAAGLVGLLIGGFIGFLFVLNALLGA